MMLKQRCGGEDDRTTKEDREFHTHHEVSTEINGVQWWG